MSEQSTQSGLKRLRNQYRLVIMNEDSFEEVVKFRLSRMSVYIWFCTIFVLLIGITASLIIFTPLKYYLPGVGYGNAKEVREYRNLKIKTDSMEQAVLRQEVYMESIKKVLEGKVRAKDTTQLSLPKIDNLDD